MGTSRSARASAAARAPLGGQRRLLRVARVYDACRQEKSSDAHGRAGWPHCTSGCPSGNAEGRAARRRVVKKSMPSGSRLFDGRFARRAGAGLLVDHQQHRPRPPGGRRRGEEPYRHRRRRRVASRRRAQKRGPAAPSSWSGAPGERVGRGAPARSAGCVADAPVTRFSSRRKVGVVGRAAAASVVRNVRRSRADDGCAAARARTPPAERRPGGSEGVAAEVHGFTRTRAARRRGARRLRLRPTWRCAVSELTDPGEARGANFRARAAYHDAIASRARSPAVRLPLFEITESKRRIA